MRRMSCESSTSRAQRLAADLAVPALVAGRRALRRLLELFLALLGDQPGLAHGLDLPQDLLLAVVDLLVGQLFVDEGDELADAALVVLELIAHLHDRPGDRRRARDRLDHRELAALDALGDLHLALAREQGHRAHLAQVHPDGVVRLVERPRREIELDFLGAFAGAVEQLLLAIGLLGVDDLDARAAERAEQIVQLVGGGDIGGQQLVDLVVEEISLFFSNRDELPHLIVFFFDRQRRSSSVTRGRHAFGPGRPGSGAGQLTPCVSVSIRCKRCFLRSQSATISVSCSAAPASCRRAISRWRWARSRSYRRRFSVRTQSAASAGAPAARADFSHQGGLSCT